MAVLARARPTLPLPPLYTTIIDRDSHIASYQRKPHLMRAGQHAGATAPSRAKAEPWLV